jgi:flavin reductase (DIM6/NTAB) family NADH-FMN oxidoreductase RutF
MIDAKTFWQVLGQRPIGVSIVTARGPDGPAGFLALSASHVTADPPSMLVSIDDRTSALAAVLHGRHFAVNYLPADAKAVAEMFGGRTESKGADRFAPEEWESLESGAPVFKRAIAAIDCALANSFRYSSTTIAVGRVVAARSGGGTPLVFQRGQFSTG